MSTTPEDPRPLDPGAVPPTNVPAGGSGGPPTSDAAAPDPPRSMESLGPVEDEAVPRPWFRRVELIVAIGTLTLAALGGAAALALAGTDDPPSDGVASIDGGAGAEETAGAPGEGSGAGDGDLQDAMLAYAECMRDNGIDMPDPQFDGDGGGFVIQENVAVSGGPGQSSGPGREDFEAAEEACGSLMEDARGDAAPLSPEDIAELQDQMVAMAECMRERGHDMPDPRVGGDGRVTVEVQGGSEGPGAGPGAEDTFLDDQEACNEQAGLESGPGAGPSAEATR